MRAAVHRLVDRNHEQAPPGCALGAVCVPPGARRIRRCAQHDAAAGRGVEPEPLEQQAVGAVGAGCEEAGNAGNRGEDPAL
jgi:hypothetical protein